MAATSCFPMFRRAMLALVLLAAAASPDWRRIGRPRPCKIIVPFGAGSTPDIVARLIADRLGQKYPGSVFLVENKPGASGNLGTDAVAKAAPDGSTIGISIGGPLAINTLLFSESALRSAARTSRRSRSSSRSRARWRSTRRSRSIRVAELVALLKANPGKYNFASIGNGSLSHLAMEAIAIKAGTKLVHVPYPSSPQAILAVIRDDAQMACLPAISVTPQAKAGKVKILAVSTAKRSPYLPDVPTLKESGIDVEADAWNGLIAPGGTPKALIDKINKDVVAIIRAPELRDKLAAQLMEPVGSTPEEFRARIDGEIARWAPVIKAASEGEFEAHPN